MKSSDETPEGNCGERKPAVTEQVVKRLSCHETAKTDISIETRTWTSAPWKYNSASRREKEKTKLRHQ